MNTFHVLVLDDSRELIQKLGSRISHQHNIAESHWRIVLHEVHVEVISKNEKLCFSEATLQRVVEACHEKPALMLFDYGFSSSQAANLPPSEYFSHTLTPADLIPALREYLQATHPNDIKLSSVVESAFIANGCPLHLYTYTGKEFRGIPPIPDERAKLTQRAFQQSKVSLIDISQELFENDAFPGNEKHFRAFLTAGLLAQTIDRELLLYILARESERLRFVRYYRSGAGVLAIVLLGGAIGAVGEWLGGRIMALLSAGYETVAIVFVLLAAILFFAVGLIIPLIFERTMSNLLSKLKSDQPDDTH